MRGFCEPCKDPGAQLVFGDVLYDRLPQVASVVQTTEFCELLNSMMLATLSSNEQESPKQGPHIHTKNADLLFLQRLGGSKSMRQDGATMEL